MRLWEGVWGCLRLEKIRNDKICSNWLRAENLVLSLHRIKLQFRFKVNTFRGPNRSKSWQTALQEQSTVHKTVNWTKTTDDWCWKWPTVPAKCATATSKKILDTIYLHLMYDDADNILRPRLISLNLNSWLTIYNLLLKLNLTA